MLDAIFWVAVGLVIGWNVLPQPQWVQVLYSKARDWIGGLFG